MFQCIQDQWYKRPFTNGLLLGIIVFFSIYLPVTNLWAPELIEIKGQSMFPALENGNRVIFLAKFEGINRGDIISFISPEREAFYCKRIIGLPGDEIILAGNGIMINGVYNPEYYIALFSNEKPQLITVPAGRYFVMGDNRPGSMDSRSFGTIPRQDIVAKLFIKIW